MRAGLMRDILVFQKKETVQTASGSMKDTYSEVFRCRAWRRKQSIVSGDEQAKEIFLGQMAVLRVRKYPEITYQCRVEWADCLWEIKMIEPDGNELTLTLKKIDK